MTWSNQDRELLFPCIGLVKTARSSFKRIGAVLQIKGKVETEEQISQLDDLVSKSEEISPAVDDLVSCMYPPMNKDAVRSAVSVHCLTSGPHSVFITCKKAIQDGKGINMHVRIEKCIQNCIGRN